MAGGQTDTPAPPDTVVILSGAEDSSFHNTAKRYAKIIGTHGIQVKVVVTDGSAENLQRLLDRKQVADVGLVQTGLTEAETPQGLNSLGTMYVQPFLVFYRDRKTLDRLTQLRGKRVAIGPDGSGTRLLSLQMLEENDMSGSNTRLLDLDGDDAIAALLEKGGCHFPHRRTSPRTKDSRTHARTWRKTHEPAASRWLPAASALPLPPGGAGR